jgi:AcrR family transcriptional regulator
MPKGFTDQEKAHIRSGLLAKGKEYFGAYGLRKTNVEDLTSAVGISKGAFYLFYDSKEALFFELLRQYEADFKATMLGDIARLGPAPAARLKAILRKALSVWKSNALFAQFSKVEYELLLRKLPPEQVQAHLSDDDSFAVEFIAAWQRAGVTIDTEPRLLTGLIRSLFFISLHEDEFGADIYPDVIETLLDLIVLRLVHS